MRLLKCLVPVAVLLLIKDASARPGKPSISKRKKSLLPSFRDHLFSTEITNIYI